MESDASHGRGRGAWRQLAAVRMVAAEVDGLVLS